MFLFFIDINELQKNNHIAIGNNIDKSIIYEFIIKNIRDKFHLNDDEDISLNYSPLGKKYFKFKDGIIYFSISYSCGYCVFVLSLESEVGIDVEMIREKRPEFYTNVVNQSFSDEEKQRFHGERQDDFFWETWTVKEAVVKYSGSGILYDLKTIIHMGHVVYWPETSQGLSLVKMKLGQCVIALLAAVDCNFEIYTHNGLFLKEIKTTFLPVLQSPFSTQPKSH